MMLVQRDACERDARRAWPRRLGYTLVALHRSRAPRGSVVPVPVAGAGASAMDGTPIR